MLSCEVREAFKSTHFEEHLQTTASGGVLLKSLINIHRTKVASDKCSVKKVFLVVDGAVKVTCFYIDQHLL